MEDTRLDWLRNVSKEVRILQNDLSGLYASWKPGVPPVVIEFATFGRSIAKHWGTINKDSLKRITDRIEEAIGSNDTSLRDAVATGLIEALMAEADEHEGLWAEIEPFLGMKTKEYIAAWRNFGR